MVYLIAFLEGVITFISPCLLPLLPVYISYFAQGRESKKTFRNALGFVIGFSIIFILMGAFFGTIGIFIKKHIDFINVITGLIVVILGLNFTGIIKIGFLNRIYKKNNVNEKKTFLSSLIFGMIFSVGWTPCVGAFLGSALMLASESGSMLRGVIMLLSYSIGLGIPFLLSAILIEKLKKTFDFIKKNYKVINIISGIFLIITGVLLATGRIGYLIRILGY
jgi:cytochrome c-type biogenesis protein